MENNKSKGILVSDTQLVDIIDKYEFLMFNLNTQIAPTINKMLVLQKEVQNLDSLLIKTSNLSKNLEQINLKIENSTDILLKQKIDDAVLTEIDKASEILDSVLLKQNQKSFKKELFLSSLGCLFLGILIGILFK
jgi:hypothetical protein